MSFSFGTASNIHKIEAPQGLDPKFQAALDKQLDQGHARFDKIKETTKGVEIQGRMSDKVDGLTTAALTQPQQQQAQLRTQPVAQR